MIYLIHADGQTSVETKAEDDAILYAALSNQITGMIEQITLNSLGSNLVNISSGKVLANGRMIIFTEEQIKVEMSSTSATIQGRIYIDINLNNIEEPVTLNSIAASTLPDLIQEDLNKNGSRHQIELATYSTNNLVISNLTNKLNLIELINTSVFNHTSLNSIVGIGKKGLFISKFAGEITNLNINGNTLAINNSKINKIILENDKIYEFVIENNIVYFYHGNMLKEIYDINNNGVVDNASNLGGYPVGSNGKRNAIPLLKADGVTDIGQYLDFRLTEGGTIFRISVASDGSKFIIGKTTEFSGNLFMIGDIYARNVARTGMTVRNGDVINAAGVTEVNSMYYRDILE